MPKTVIVNSTPLIALAGIGELEILRSVYGQINIPKAVYNEVTVKSGKVSDAVRAADWINIVEIKDVDSKKMYKAKLSHKYSKGSGRRVTLCLYSSDP